MESAQSQEMNRREGEELVHGHVREAGNGLSETAVHEGVGGFCSPYPAKDEGRIHTRSGGKVKRNVKLEEMRDNEQQQD